jgi:hypothetical protein
MLKLVPQDMCQTLSVEQRVLLALAYTDQFAFPLTERELMARLPGNVAPSIARFKSAVAKLLKMGAIEKGKNGTFFVLAGRGEWYAQRRVRQKVSEAKWQEVQQFVQRTSWLPWVRAIFVTGSLAMNNADAENDCDFMIITQPRRLWLCRAVVAVVTGISGKRRSWLGAERASWCLNLWLDDQSMEVPLERRSLYLAYEVTQAAPVFDRGGAVALFWTNNAWVSEFLAGWKSDEQHIALGSRMQLPRELSILAPIWDGLDWLSWQLQLWYMRPHRTTERVGRGFAYFHPRDTQGIIKKNWKRSLLAVEKYSNIDTKILRKAIDFL